MTRASLVLPVLVVTSALALAGCTAPEVIPTAQITTLDAPASLSPTEPTVSVSTTILPATDSLPYLVSGDLTPPGEVAHPTTWISQDGLAWKESTVSDELDGSFSSTLAGDDELAIIAGTLWSAGTQTTHVFTSTDRESWSEVSVPDDLAAPYRIVDLAVSEGVGYAIGVDAVGASTGIRIDGDTVEAFALPEVDDEQLLQAASIGARDGTVVLVARPGTEGQASSPVAFVSDDAGASWGKANPIADEGAAIAGLAVAEGTWVATGTAPASDNPGAASGSAAWSSEDGATWVEESVPVVTDGDFAIFGNAAFGLDAPNSHDGLVSAVGWNNDASVSGLFRRDADGVWTYLTNTSANASNGAGGSALAIDQTTTLAVISAQNAARIGVLQPENGWVDLLVLSEREDLANASAIYPGEDRTLMTTSRSTFTIEADGGWRNSTAYQLTEITAEGVTEADWSPKSAADLTSVQLASDEEGAEILVGASFPPGAKTIIATGWFRETSDADWTPIQGFESGGATHFVGATKIGDSWYAYGDYRDSSALADPSHGLVWSSSDGVTWTRGTGDFGSGALETQVNDLCALPDGTPVAIGWVQESSTEYRTAVWLGDDGAWSLADIGDLASGYGYGSSCATGDDGVVLNAYDGGRNTLQLSSDGSEWTEVFRADRGIDFGKPVAVDGGFAAPGRLVKDNFATPVVWLSGDGASWAAVSVPSRKDGSTSSVAALGKDLIVTMSGRTGDPVILVKDIAGVIATN